MITSAAARDLAADPTVAAQATEKMQELLARSATDAGFRALLLSDPRAAVAEFRGVAPDQVPETFNVRFVENRADATIVLPEFVDAAAELSDADLEAVAGGVTPTLITIPIVVSISMYTMGTFDAR